MVNIDKLRGVIKEKRETIASVAKAIGINCATFYRKMNCGGDSFTIREVMAICDFLNLDANTAMSIFFNFFVA